MTPVSRALAAGVSVLALAAPAVAQTAISPTLIAQAGDSYFIAARGRARGAHRPPAERARGEERDPLRRRRHVDPDRHRRPHPRRASRPAATARATSSPSRTCCRTSRSSKTYTHDAQVADCAPTATAMVSGVKSNNGTIGVTQAVENDVCASQKGHEVTTIFELAEAAGYATGIVSTARITHATPAATYAKTAQRDWENDSHLSDEAKADGCKDIAAQLVDWPAGDGFEVILGGGRANFMLADQADPEAADETGARADGRDLVAEWQAKHNDAAYVWNKEGFDAVDPATTGHLFGLFERSHMQYETDRDDGRGEPSLAEMTVQGDRRALAERPGLRADGRGRPHRPRPPRRQRLPRARGHHRADAAVKAAFDKVDPEETLIIVTADHGHVFTIAGYPERNNPILGLTGEAADDGKPYTTLGYMNGPGAVAGERARPDRGRHQPIPTSCSRRWCRSRRARPMRATTWASTPRARGRTCSTAWSSRT